MNQLRIPTLLSRRCLTVAPSLLRTNVLAKVATRTAYMRTPHGSSWGQQLKTTADHGAEILVLFMYFCITLALLAYHMIYVSIFKKNEITLTPTNRDLNDIFSVRLDWNDPRGQRSMGPLCRRHVKFFENKLGWKDDLKDLLNEIYAFSKPGAVNPSHIVVPSALEGMSKSMILQDDQNKSTELMRAALREVLSES